MLLTIATTHQPATDLGYLLRKNPARLQSFRLSFGTAWVFYPEATDEQCEMALQVEVDPVGLVRNRRGPQGEARTLDQYVNDRPYAASSFLSVAIADVFGTALSGVCKERPGLEDLPLPFEVTVAALPCRGGEELLRRMFEPLGYAVETEPLPLDSRFSEWGVSRYFRVKLSAKIPLQRLLSHLYVLVPVLDNDKHYWVGEDEVSKLLRHGEGWLATHPERELVARRYLKHQRRLVEDAMSQLVVETGVDPDEEQQRQDAEEMALESCVSAAGTAVAIGTPEADARVEEETGGSLNEQRMGTVLAVLKSTRASRVLDLGCGEGRLLRALLKESQFSEIVGVDVSHRALEVARDRIRYDRMSEIQRARVKILQGSLMYRDQRISSYEAAAVVEVIEHLDAPRLAAFERVVFGCAKPDHVVVTTPNREYNVKWESLPGGQFRHRDHRFEWTRAEFRTWAERVASGFGYRVRYLPVGPEDATVGPPTQLALFERNSP